MNNTRREGGWPKEIESVAESDQDHNLHIKKDICQISNNILFRYNNSLENYRNIKEIRPIPK